MRNQKIRMFLAAPVLFLPLFVIAANAWAQDEVDYIYKLTQSTGSYEFWTTTPSERVFKDDAVPADTSSGVLVYAARNEFEPFQIVVRPESSGSVTVNVGNFGSGIEVKIYQVKYVYISQATDSLGRTGDYPDPLWPMETGGSTNLVSGENTAFWFDVYVPGTAAPGDYSTNVNIGGVDIPVTLHVFNFSIPDALHAKSQMNLSHQTILDKYSVDCCGSEYWMYVDNIKQYFNDHRLTPKGVLGGLTSSGAGPYIDYDCAGTLNDNAGIWGFEEPAERYLEGTGLMQGKLRKPLMMGPGFLPLWPPPFKTTTPPRINDP